MTLLIVINYVYHSRQLDDSNQVGRMKLVLNFWSRKLDKNHIRIGINIINHQVYEDMVQYQSAFKEPM